MSRGCGFEGVMEADFNVDVHTLYPCSFLLLDRSHLLPLEVRLYGFEYPPPVPRKVRGGGRTGLHLPGIPAEQEQWGEVIVTELKGMGYGTQLRHARRAAGLDVQPLRCFHPSQPGSLLDRTALGLADFPDTTAEQQAPGLAAKVILAVILPTHIHITPVNAPRQADRGGAD